MPTFDRSSPVLSESKFERLLDNILLNAGMDSRSIQSSPSTAGKLTGRYITFASTAAKVHILPLPDPPNKTFAMLLSTSTAGTKLQIESTLATFDGTNHVITFDGQGDSVELLAISPTRYLIMNSTSLPALTTV